jgi:hypothetical protein
LDNAAIPHSARFFNHSFPAPPTSAPLRQIHRKLPAHPKKSFFPLDQIAPANIVICARFSPVAADRFAEGAGAERRISSVDFGVF